MHNLFNQSMVISNAAEVQQTRDVEMVLNAWQEDRERMSALLGDASGNLFADTVRNIDDECGYPETTAITISEYQKLYERNEIAARVVDVMPDSCWQVEPSVYENKDVEDTTAFEQAWKDLPNKLNNGSWLETEQGNPIWEALEQLHVLSGIGRFGGLLIGINDGKKLEEPADLRRTENNEKGGTTGRDIIYLRPLSENDCKINILNNDSSSTRYGLPEQYEVTLTTTRTTTSIKDTTTVKVHWTRILHYSDRGVIEHSPRMQTVYNRLYDLHKLYGGSAEMYWQGAFPGLSIETDPHLAKQPWTAEDITAMAQQMSNYRRRLQRHLHLKGSKANSLAPQVVDPSNHIDKELEAICVHIVCPKRVFVGSERGELASSQDIKSWNKRVKKVQNRRLTPRMVGPFIDRLIMLNVLPVPTSGSYVTEWPEIEEQAPTEIAEIADKQVTALAKYVAAGVEELIAPESLLTDILGFTQEQAKHIMKVADEFTSGDNEPDEEELALETKEDENE